MKGSWDRRCWRKSCPSGGGQAEVGGLNWEEPGLLSGLCLTHFTFAASSRPSILAHQVPNAKKLKRKDQLWEKLVKQGEVPRDVRRAQARLLNPPVAKAKPGPQDTVERPFYDLWAKDSKCLCCHLWVGTRLSYMVVRVVHCTRAPCLRGGGCPVAVALTIFSRVTRLKVVPFSHVCSTFSSGLS